MATNVRKFGVMEIPPGVSIGLHDHAGEEEFYYILAGSGLVNDGVSAGLTEVSQGFSTLTSHLARHSIVNNSQEKLVILTTVVRFS